MSVLLERLKAHYADQPRRRITIDLGDGQGPALITWTPLTVRDRERIYEPDDKGRSPGGSTVILRALIIKAEDEKGKRLFDGMAEHDLRHSVDAEVVGKIANAILFDGGMTDDAGKPIDASDQIDAAKNA